MATLVFVFGCASAGKDHVGVDGNNNPGIDGHIGNIDSAVSIDGPPACTPQTVDLLANGNFDAAPLAMGWTQTTPPIVMAPGTGLPAAQTAPNIAYLGGITSITDVLQQDIAVPASATNIVLTGFYDVRTNEAAGTIVYDRCKVELVTTGGTLIEAIGSYDNTKPKTAWTALTHQVTANVAGQTVRLRFTAVNDVSNLTSFFFDTLKLATTVCP